VFFFGCPFLLRFVEEESKEDGKEDGKEASCVSSTRFRNDASNIFV
jgi:hypothetical protein